MKQIIILFILATFSLGAIAQGKIIVEGKSSVKLVPEQLIFNINMSVKDSNYTECANLAIEKIEKIKEQFTKNGIDEELIKTQNYSIREVRRHDYKTQKSVFEGFQASIPISIKTNRSYAKNDLIFEIIKNNFNADFSLNFSLTSEQLEKVKVKLIALAVKDAQQKAEIIAQSANIELGAINTIQYGEPREIRGFEPINELMMSGRMAKMEADVANFTSSITPDDVEMRTKIDISWTIKN